MFTCPSCGDISKDDVNIYNDSLRKQNIRISPVLPTCRRCGAEVSVSHICDGGSIVVLTGTCGSGKSTVAELLTDRGFLAIDGDCVIQAVRHKTGKKQYEWGQLVVEIASELDILSLFGKNIVLSHVVLPEDLDKLVGVFEARKMRYRFFLLKPEYATAVERCQTRTCHTSVTPEVWIRHFYDLLVYDERVEVVDNTGMTPEQTADYIAEQVFELPEGIPAKDFVKVKFINKGCSPDKKYYVETTDGKRLLLRIADADELERKQKEYKMLELAATTGVLMSYPIDFGLCDGGKKVYQLLGWVDGIDLLEALPDMPPEQRYDVGRKAGELLKRLHSIPAPDDVVPWGEVFRKKISGRLGQLEKRGIQSSEIDLLADYLRENDYLLNNRPQCLNHGDYNITNLILTPDGQIGVVDFNAFTSIYGDPYWDFCTIPDGYKPCGYYYSGMILGYFGGEPRDDFFPLLAYYFAYCEIAAVCEN